MRHTTALLAVLLAACAAQTPQKRLFDELDSATSWMATLQFAGEKWIANSVPDSFLRDCVRAAVPVLQNGIRSIDASQAPDDLRQELRLQLNRSIELAGALRSAMSRGDRAAAARIVAQLRAANAAVQRLESAQR